VRDFTYREGAAAQAADSLGQLEVEAAATLANLREQASRKYSEAVALWMHVKAVRVFVESVLRCVARVCFGLLGSTVCV
jgi:hypothetical protein